MAPPSSSDACIHWRGVLLLVLLLLVLLLLVLLLVLLLLLSSSPGPKTTQHRCPSTHATGGSCHPRG